HGRHDSTGLGTRDAGLAAEHEVRGKYQRVGERRRRRAKDAECRQKQPQPLATYSRTETRHVLCFSELNRLQPKETPRHPRKNWALPGITTQAPSQSDDRPTKASHVSAREGRAQIGVSDSQRKRATLGARSSQLPSVSKIRADHRPPVY